MNRMVSRVVTPCRFLCCLINQAPWNEAEWGSGGMVPPFLTSAVDGGEWSASRPGGFISEETAHGARYVGGWVSTRDGLDAVE
jgi:hypothetical protein